MVVLLAFVAASVGRLVLGSRGEASAVDSIAVESVETAADRPSGRERDKVILYYFHTTYRCATCRKFEAYAKDLLNKHFRAEVESGLLAWSAVDVEKKANRHFVTDFGLFTKSLVLVEQRGGRRTRWKNLDRIWEEVQDETAFKSYVRGEIAAFLAGA